MKTIEKNNKIRKFAMFLGMAMLLGFSVSATPESSLAVVNSDPVASHWNSANGPASDGVLAKAPEDNRGKGRTGLLSKKGFDDPPGDDRRGGRGRLLAKAPEDNRGKGRTGLLSKKGFDDPPGDDRRGGRGRLLAKAPEDNRGKGRTGLLSTMEAEA